MQKNKISKVISKNMVGLKRQEIDAVGGGKKCRCYCGSESFGSTYIGVKDNPLDCSYACEPKMYRCK
jgi:hypothetical protein